MSHTSFLGIPVEGDISKSDRTEQRPLADLEPLIRAVLEDEFIDSFGWKQYTPYFNDGEPCIFRVGEVWFRTVEDVKAGSEDDDDDSFIVFYGAAHPTLGERDYTFIDRQRVEKAYTGDHEQLYDACVALARAIASDAFDDVLFDAFGDHAEVKVRRTGITVETYEHD